MQYVSSGGGNGAIKREGGDDDLYNISDNEASGNANLGDRKSSSPKAVPTPPGHAGETLVFRGLPYTEDVEGYDEAYRQQRGGGFKELYLENGEETEGE